MKISLLLAATVILLQACTSSPSGVVRGRGATYHYTDWRTQSPQTAFDVAPAPGGGMTSLIAHLDYPSELRAKHIGGVMRVFVSLDSAGRILDAHIVQSVHPRLDRIVLDAVTHVRWSPALKNNVPVPARATFPITFLPP